MKIADIRLFRVDGEGPAWEFEDRAVEALDLYPDHVAVVADAESLPLEGRIVVHWD